MSGGILQLVARGVEDLYLSHNPQITFFKIIYRRHTNFATESVMQRFSSPADFGETVSCTLMRVGDLVSKTFLYVKIPSIPLFIDPVTGEIDRNKKIAWVKHLGYAIIHDVSIIIDDKVIDKQYGEWLYIWNQVSGTHNIDKMIGNLPQLHDFSNGKQEYELYIPLEFWFCRHSGLALPLLSLKSSEIKLVVNFRRLEECYRIGPTHSIQIAEDISAITENSFIEQHVNKQAIHGYVTSYDFLTKTLYYIKINSPHAVLKKFEEGNKIYDSWTGNYVTPVGEEKEESLGLFYRPKIVDSFLFVNYVYLDHEERAKFHGTNHEYLIEQIQYNQEINVRSANVKQNLNLHHSCKSHYWVVQLDGLVGPKTINDLFNYTSSHLQGDNIVENFSMLFNGLERFPLRDISYANLVQPLDHHSRGPDTGINCLSFGLNPEEYQPSAAANMSEVEGIQMTMKLKIAPHQSVKIRSYTINYNIFRVYFNMGRLAFI